MTLTTNLGSACLLAFSCALTIPAMAEQIDVKGNPDTIFTDDPAFKKAMACPQSTTLPFTEILGLRMDAKLADTVGAMVEVMNQANSGNKPLPLPPDTTIFQLAANGILPSAHAETLSHKRVYESMNGFRPSSEEIHAYFCKAVEEKSTAVLKAFKPLAPR